ncbi:MAG: SOS response-associated peptidase [Anaerolineae bacterium]
MCGRFTLAAKLEELGQHFGATPELEGYHASYNIAPSLDVPVVWASPNVGRRLSWMHWGLIPHWAKEPHTKYKMINAKAETLTSKPAYRQPFKYRRCLIPADGFYEWKPEGKTKQPYYIQMQDKDLFALAGLWECWEGEKTIYSFTIITTDANDVAGRIHDRMPVIIDPPDYDTWLDPNLQETRQLEPLLKPYQGRAMRAYPVSKQVNKPANASPALIQPTEG